MKWRTLILLLVPVHCVVLGCARPSFDDLNVQYSDAFNAGEFGKAAEIAEKQLIAAQEEFGSDTDKFALSLNKLGLAELNTGRAKAAEAHHEAALRIYESLHGRKHESVARSLHYLSQAYLAQGKTGWAIETCKRSLQVYGDLFGPDHFLTAAQMNSLALIYIKEGELKTADRLLERALRAMRYNLKASNPSIAAVSNNLALVREMLQKNQAD